MVIILVLSFLAGFQMGNIVLNPLKSGVSTLFVCIAWDPAVLQRDHQDLYARIAVVYPGVQHVLVNV